MYAYVHMHVKSINKGHPAFFAKIIQSQGILPQCRHP